LLSAALEVMHAEKSWLPAQLSGVPTEEKLEISARVLVSVIPSTATRCCSVTLCTVFYTITILQHFYLNTLASAVGDSSHWKLH